MQNLMIGNTQSVNTKVDNRPSKGVHVLVLEFQTGDGFTSISVHANTQEQLDRIIGQLSGQLNHIIAERVGENEPS